MYHIEIRKFPHNACRFNLSESELAVIVIPWAREEWIEFGERKWNSNEAKLTVLEGPQLELRALTMGRGWRNAQHESTDVTERVLAFAKAYIDGKRSDAPAARTATAREAQASESSLGPAQADGASPDSALLADSLGIELLSLLADGPVPLSEAWRLAEARLPGGPAADGLALAEHAVSSLLSRRLIVLEPIADPQAGMVLDDQQLQLALRALESWGSAGRPGAIRVRRA